MRLATIAAFAIPLVAQTPEADRAGIFAAVDRQAPRYGTVARQMWEWAELGYQEHRSAALLREQLAASGFAIRDAIGGMPTAFIAEWGSGKPVIGILGEMDALPGLSQEAAPEQRPRSAGGAGHGCGHNLFGPASALAAETVKRYLVEHKLSGTIRFYATPAEEGGAGKVYLVRAGAFADADVVLAWHPSDKNQVNLSSSLANISAKFRFHGRAAHAANNPEEGRSALDAVLLMNHGVELLREHVPQATRLHYVITNGGAAPNVVPDFAEVYMYARHPSMPLLDGVWARVIRCAEGAALATETRMEMEIVHSVWNVLPNEPLAALVDRNLGLAGGIRYTAEEEEFARRLRATFGKAPEGNPQETVLPPERGRPPTTSTDVGDVSWQVPVIEFNTATWVPGTPYHSWQAVACSGMSIGQKGMTLAAKVLALTAADLILDPKQVAAAKADFERRRASDVYRSRIPAGQKPPLTYRVR